MPAISNTKGFNIGKSCFRNNWKGWRFVSSGPPLTVYFTIAAASRVRKLLLPSTGEETAKKRCQTTAALKPRQLASEGCGSHGTHSPRSKPHIHVRARGRRILLPLFHFPNFKGRISWANDTQKPTGRGSEPSNPRRQGMYYRMPSLYLAYHPFSILQNHTEIMIYCYIFHFLWPCGLIFYCNFSRLLAGQWNNLAWSLQSPEVHVQKQTD